MSMPLIDPLPPAPTPADPEDVFDEKAYETVAALAPFVDQTNALAVAVEQQADKSEAEANRSQAQVGAATIEANRAQTEAERAKDEADRAEQARDDAVVVVTDGQGSLTPAPGKFPVAGADAAIQQAWIKGLEFELDALRVARNKLMYGDGPYPVLDLQFKGAKKLDPRVTFTRATPDWDGDGNEYGVDEPVLTDEGFMLNSIRANLVSYNRDLTKGWAHSNVTTEVTYDEVLGCSTIQMKTSAGYVQYSSADIVKDRFYTLQATLRPVQIGNGEIRIFLHHVLFNLEEASVGCNIRQDGSFIPTGNPIDLSVSKFKDGWFKVKFSAIAKKTTESSELAIYTDARGRLSTPTVGLEYEIKDVQLEHGEATPVIPTNGSQVTVARAQRNDNIPPVRSKDFTLIFDKQKHTAWRVGTWKTDMRIRDSDGKQVFLLQQRPDESKTHYIALPNSNITPVTGIEDAGLMAVSYSDGVWKIFKGGRLVLRHEDRFSGQLQSLEYQSIGSSLSIATGYHAKTQFYDKALSDEQLQELTA